MARIRSTHPGQWTDEDFVQCSPFARLLALALRNEADDNGAFEWKPVTIKMRLLPVDNVNVEELLAELIEHNQVTKYEIYGRHYGLIRNFKKYQKPKEPKYVHPTPTGTGNDETSTKPTSEVDGDKVLPFPGKSETEPQREEGRGRRKDGKEDSSAHADDGFPEFYDAYPRHEGRGQAAKAYRSALKKAERSVLLAGAVQARERYRETEKQFIPLPATWLNGERWLDEPGPTPVMPDDPYYGVTY